MPWYTETRPLRRSLPSTWRSWPQPTLRRNSPFILLEDFSFGKKTRPVFPVWLTVMDRNLEDCGHLMWLAGDSASWHSSRGSASRRLFQPEGCGWLLVMRLWPFWFFKDEHTDRCTDLCFVLVSQWFRFHVWFYPGRCYREVCKMKPITQDGL